MDNIETVQDIYAAFGRGDIPAILERLAEDVRWDDYPHANGGAEAGVPWLQARHGRDGVQEFFATLAPLDIGRFEPLAYMADGDRVAALIDIELTDRESGRTIADEELHLWRFDDSGRVVEFRHYVDTAKHIHLAGLVGTAA